ncbi:outer membrane protein assembly factor BamE [Candidatus Erwinia haradaeae]|uniref:Outer membrane protein assembly factor BamE n=1 Tax=Candidatus Erwinia haradaeae TaxID=1922217 RepID=A0A803FSW1_9GAMM|nr:outer membrane protein assembly factor BamE [Candidatus Erwinia haradaeae]VFP87212.1 Outer membrane protein assembly factor BamE [Candidatus Erwinia haradaeae]
MISYNAWIAPIFCLMITASCSSLDQVLYRQDINQGDCLRTESITRIRIGMTKQQVSYILGKSIINHSLQSNIWHYVCRQESRYQPVHQQILILIFDKNDHLISMDNKVSTLIKDTDLKKSILSS